MMLAESGPKSGRRSRENALDADRIRSQIWASIPGNRFRCAKFSRRHCDSIAGLSGERRLPNEDGTGIESIGRRRRDARLSQDSPDLSTLDDRVGRQSQVFKTANHSANA